jgi:hypothetical protein
MDYHKKYLKYKNKYLKLKFIQKGSGDYLFKVGDKFEYNGQIGRVIRIAKIDEFGGNFYYASHNYVVEFDGFGKHSASYNFGDDRYIMDENDMKPISDTVDFNFSEKSVKSNKPESIKKCIFSVGDKISVSNVNLRLKNPFRDEFISFKSGKISEIYPLSEFTNPPYLCLYEIKFDDGTIAVEVPENVINKYALQTQNTQNIQTTDIQDIIKPNYNFIPKNNDIDYLTSIALSTISDSQVIINPYVKPTKKFVELNINDNTDLQENITKFFHNKMLKKLKNKKHLKMVKSTKGKLYINKMLKQFVVKNNVNWYELRNEDNYDDVIDYLLDKISDL